MIQAFVSKLIGLPVLRIMSMSVKEAIVFMCQLLTIASEWFHLTDHVGVSCPVKIISPEHVK